MESGLFKMNVMNIIRDLSNNKTTSLVYLTESSILWHDRLGHVNYNSLRKLMNLDLLPKCHINLNIECQICVEAKLIKTSFHIVERSSEPLDLIHSDICDLKFIQTRGGKVFYYFY